MLLFVVAAVFLFFVAFHLGESPKNLAQTEFALTCTMRILGGLIAAVAAFGMLLRSLASETLERQLGFALPLLGGILLTGPHWSAALALGAVGVGLVAKAAVARTAIPREEGASGPGKATTPFTSRGDESQ